MKSKFLLVALLIPFTLGLLAVADRDVRLEKQEIVPQAVEEPVTGAMEACQLSYTNSNIVSYFGGFASGHRIVSLFRPSLCPVGSQYYPFNIESLDLTLLDGGDYQGR